MADVNLNAQTATGDGSVKALLTHASDLSALGQSTFADIAGIFQAIKQLAVDGSTIQRLASVGSYLADDWANVNDCEREALDAARAFNKLTGEV